MRYISVVVAIWKFWFMRIFEYRFEVILWSINSIFWAFGMLAAVVLMFSQVTTIAGWSKYDVLLIMATQELFVGLLWLWIIPSLLALSSSIRTGNLDSYLTKPIPSQFLVSTMKFEFDNYIRVAVMGGTIVVLAWGNHSVNSFGAVVGYIAMLGIGMLLFYSLFFILTTLTFWLTQIHNLEDFFDSVLSVGKYPAYIFQHGARVFFFYILPVVFISTFPIEVLRGRAGWDRIGLGLVLACVFLFISNRFWHFALRRYASASS